MTITKTKPVKLTPREKAVELMKQYRELRMQRDSYNTQLKELENSLHELAQQNRGWFQEKNTVALDVHGKISFVNENQIAYDLDTYDEKAFYAAFPECIDLKPRLSAVKGLCINEGVKAEIESYGVSIVQVEKFKVEPSK